MEPVEEADDDLFEDADLLEAFAGANRFNDDDALADAVVNIVSNPILTKPRRARLPLPWLLVATFTGAPCARLAREALREYAGQEWFDSKGKVRKSRETSFRPGIPLSQTPRVNRDGTAVSEAKCPFSSVLAPDCATYISSCACPCNGNCEANVIFVTLAEPWLSLPVEGGRSRRHLAVTSFCGKPARPLPRQGSCFGIQEVLSGCYG